MGKRQMAGGALALALLLAVAAPLAGAIGKTAIIVDGEGIPVTAPKREETEVPAEQEEETPARLEEAPAEDGTLAIVEIQEPAAALADVRSVPVAGVPAEGRDAACYAVFRGLLPLGEDGDFGAEEPVNRGEAVAALYALSGIQVRVDSCRYDDVPEALQDAVAWACSVGVSGGVSEKRFAPAERLTRSQLAVMLHRFARWRGEEGTDSFADVSVYEDGQAVPDYAAEALGWALEKGLYQGMTDHGLYPALPVSRLQLAAVLARMQRERDPLVAELLLPEGGPASASRQDHETLAAAVSGIARRYGAVGVQVAVIEKGAVTDTYHYGWAVKGSVPMTVRHKLRTASLSKVMVGLSAALLQEEGVIDYEEDISVYWGKNARNPRCPDKPVTIQSILTHTSTLGNSESLAWNLQGVQAQLGSAAGYGSGTPGSLASWSYNNHAFGILGQTLELASGRYLDEILGERLLTPLGADGAFAAGELREPELVTPLYRVSGALGRSAASVSSVKHWSAPGSTGRQFAGGFTASAYDCAKLTAVLAGDGCFEGVRLMDAASVEQMEHHSWTALPGGSYQAQSMRYRMNIYGRESLYYHTGSAYGVYNLLSYDPSTGDGVVVLTMGANGEQDDYDIYAVCGEISKMVYDAIR